MMKERKLPLPRWMFAVLVVLLFLLVLGTGWVALARGIGPDGFLRSGFLPAWVSRLAITAAFPTGALWFLGPPALLALVWTIVCTAAALHKSQGKPDSSPAPLALPAQAGPPSAPVPALSSVPDGKKEKKQKNPPAVSVPSPTSPVWEAKRETISIGAVRASFRKEEAGGAPQPLLRPVPAEGDAVAIYGRDTASEFEPPYLHCNLSGTLEDFKTSLGREDSSPLDVVFDDGSIPLDGEDSERLGRVRALNPDLVLEQIRQRNALVELEMKREEPQAADGIYLNRNDIEE